MKIAILGLTEPGITHQLPKAFWEGKGWDADTKTTGVDVKDPSGKVVPIYGGLAGAQSIPVVQVQLLWDKEAKSWRKDISGLLKPLKGVDADPEFLAKFEPAKAELLAWVERPIGKMEGKLVFNARYNSYDTSVRPYNYDSVAGIKYVVDVTKPAGSRVTILSMADGSPFDMAKTYTVAINSYRAAGGGNHLTRGVGLDLK